MKTLTLTSDVLFSKSLVEMVRKDSVPVATEEGRSFILSPTDEFAAEVELLRRNDGFLTMLDRTAGRRGCDFVGAVGKGIFRR